MTFNIGEKIIIQDKKLYTQDGEKIFCIEKNQAVITDCNGDYVEYKIEKSISVKNPPVFWVSPVGNKGGFKADYADFLNIVKK